MSDLTGLYRTGRCFREDWGELWFAERADAIQGGGLVLAVTAFASDSLIAVSVMELNQPADVVGFITG